MIVIKNKKKRKAFKMTDKATVDPHPHLSVCLRRLPRHEPNSEAKVSDDSSEVPTQQDILALEVPEGGTNKHTHTHN